MAQHDYVIANGTGAAVRSDLNNALAAIVSQNSGATEPATTYAFQFWADTTTGLLKLRNSSNNAWVTLFQLDGEWSTLPVENGTAAAPSIYFKDSGTDTGFYSPGTDQVAISTGGTGRLFINSSGSVGIGTSSPSSLLHLSVATAASDGTKGVRITNPAGTAAMFECGSSNDSYIGTTSGSDFSIRTNNTSRIYVTNGGNVGIGTTSPAVTTHISSSSAEVLRLQHASTPYQSFYLGSNRGAYILSNTSYLEISAESTSNNTIMFSTSGAEKARLDSSGRLLVGTSSTSQDFKLVVQGNPANNEGRVAIQTATTNPSTGTAVGRIFFSDGNGNVCSNIACESDGTWGTNDYPGRLVFSTTADGASSPTERMRINNDGSIVGGGNTLSANLYSNPGFSLRTGSGSNFEGLSLSKTSTGWGTAVYIHRSFSAGDGTLIEFAHDTATEGTISVSGTTVSYNGGHLSRWSQTVNANNATLLKGTVMTNLDEMCEWFKEDGTLEENEQLNKMAVSSVEGDPNVAGVLVSIDDDGDLNVGMTGDMIIRIAEGVTVERGDLLISAGDGTAKPQDDDIIRSKTIAKVTSTNVSCTYDDGSYCVPCVLMAC